MAETVKNFWLGMPLGMYIILILAVTLGVAGFIVPPMGIIDGSVLKGMALILGGAWLFYTTANIPTILANGAKIKASYGNANIEIGRKHLTEIREEKEDHNDIEEFDGQYSDNSEE